MLNEIKNEMEKNEVSVDVQLDGSLSANVSDYGSVGTIFVNLKEMWLELIFMSLSPAFQAYENLKNAASREIAKKSVSEAVFEVISLYGFENLDLEWGDETLNASIKFHLTDCSESEFAENAVDEIFKFIEAVNANCDAIINKAWERCAINNHNQIQANLTATRVAAKVAVENFKGIFKNLSGAEIDLFSENYQQVGG